MIQRLTLIVFIGLLASNACSQEKPSVKRAPASLEARTMLIDFADSGQLRMVLEIDRLSVDTPYGELSIPVQDIRQIEFATRLTDQEQKRIEAAVFNLGSSDFALRETATRELLGLKEKAYPQVVRATKHADLEVSQRAQELVLKLRDTVPAEKLVVREFDIIETQHSKIAGRIASPAITVQTAQFGKQELKLSDVHSLKSLLASPDEPDPVNIEPDPGSLTGYTDKVGHSFAFKVTGRVDGFAWGTGVYTTDSTLAVAAVHAGALKAGETGIVRVTMIPSPAAFASTTQNGVTSSPWGVYPAAYQIHVPKK